MPVVTVLGATGTQGGGVCQALLSHPDWTIRGVTRNPSSEAAKALDAKGVEVVRADLDDEASLAMAFEGASAVFCVSNFGELSAIKSSLEEAAAYETGQLIRAAKAAAASSTLEHFVLSALPPVEGLSKGRFKAPHLDSKHHALEYIDQNLPELAPKTTAIWLGWYASSFLNPLFKPHFLPNIGKYLWFLPSKADALLPSAGDAGANAGTVAKAVLEHPEKTKEKIVPVVAEHIPVTIALEAWEKVTGKSAIYGEVSDAHFEKTFEPWGTEMVNQLRFSEQFPRWDVLFPKRTVTIEQLGIQDQIVGTEGGLVFIKETAGLEQLI
ncbi:hypothetical protein CEP54_016239 [Fusarium duplospermum]|uniref:NmrA-like domain-containing protein n=1 Tax=Fusarium duplospermum TaxID=1325734 RepID=A0A428NGM7_9HYPO|nr:hypothetical protein CEP54_016239 [Fusarium duplospermum]